MRDPNKGTDRIEIIIQKAPEPRKTLADSVDRYELHLSIYSGHIIKRVKVIIDGVHETLDDDLQGYPAVVKMAIKSIIMYGPVFPLPGASIPSIGLIVWLKSREIRAWATKLLGKKEKK